MSVNNSLLRPLLEFRTEEQKRTFLPPLPDFKLGCFGLTEPMSGSIPDHENGREKDGGTLRDQRIEELITNGLSQ